MYNMIPLDKKRLALLAQMRKGALESCVLALLRDDELYGFELVKRLAEIDNMVTSEGTIYPLLSRLRKEGLVETSWSESDSGPPRRYYKLTVAGHNALALFIEEWTKFKTSVDRLLEDN